MKNIKEARAMHCLISLPLKIVVSMKTQNIHEKPRFFNESPFFLSWFPDAFMKNCHEKTIRNYHQAVRACESHGKMQQPTIESINTTLF